MLEVKRVVRGLAAAALFECAGAQTIDRLADGTPCRSTEGVFSTDFASAVVVYSNLGGRGPDLQSPPRILLRNVGTYGGVRVDLSISNLTEYNSPLALHNGLIRRNNGTFGVVRPSLRERGWQTATHRTRHGDSSTRARAHRSRCTRHSAARHTTLPSSSCASAF
jgi:hypothetical protein